MNERDQMLTSLLSCERKDLYLKPKALTDFEVDQLNQMLERRVKGEPLQYIIGDADFMGCKIYVNPSVLIPRPETEILVEAAINAFKDKELKPIKILDLGTGSGNITIALAKYFKKAKIMAIDVSLEALRIAKKNVLLNEVEERVELVCCNMENYFKNNRTRNSFDLIISNPPYIETSLLRELPEDVKREPRIALDGGWDGLRFYRLIIEQSHLYLENNGFIFLEIGDNQDTRIESLLKKINQYKNIHFIKDYVGTNRVICVQKD